MATGTLTARLRPLRIAFVVEPNDPAAVLTAIKTSSFLWGGTYNPLIPYYRRLPRGWVEQRTGNSHTAASVLEGYLDAFDPDVVALVGQLENKGLTFGHREVVKCSSLVTKSNRGFEGISHGIDLYEVFEGFRDAELKYVRNEPIPICLPTPSRKDDLFFAALFGSLPNGMYKPFKEGISKIPGLAPLDCQSAEYAERLQPGILSLRRLGIFNIRPLSLSHLHSDAVFFMDSQHAGDVIDFWNLRALGWRVVPVCHRTAGTPQVRKAVEKFIDLNYWPHRDNPQFYNETLFLLSRAALGNAALNFTKTLALSAHQSAGNSPLVVMPYYPRIWDAWAREKDGAVPCRLDVAEQISDISNDEGSVRFTGLMPDFANRYSGLSEHRCANDVELSLWGARRPFAEIVPEGGREMVGATTQLGFREWRCSQSGLVCFPRYKDWRTSLPLPDAAAVFSAWLKERGWRTALSDKGFIAQRIMQQLGGSYGLSFLSIHGMLGFLAKLAQGQTMRGQQLFGELNKLCQLPQNRLASADRLAQRLVSANIVQLGIEVQCPHCRQHPWYSLSEAVVQVICKHCLTEFTLPTGAPKELIWTYRAIGPFSSPVIDRSEGDRVRLPTQSQGSLAVLLGLRFFSEVVHGSITPILSFSASKGDKVLEADLALFFRESKFRSCRTDTIFVESKSFNRFQAKDAARMRVLGAEFPGAFLVFSTLNDTLSPEEQAAIAPVVNRGRRYWKHERPYNPVLILTANELLAEFSLEQTWQSLGGTHARRAHGLHGEDFLLQVADATQEIYLGLPPWHQWLLERRKKTKPATVALGVTPPATAPPAPGSQKIMESGTPGLPVRGRRIPFL